MAINLLIPFVVTTVIAAGTGGILWARRKKKGTALPSTPGVPRPGVLEEPKSPTGDVAEPGTEGDAKSGAEWVQEYIGLYDVESFHNPQSGDSPAGVARKALKKIHPAVTNQQVAAYRRAIALSQYNRDVVGEPTKDGKSTFFYPGGVTIDKAFLPKHEGIDVLAAGYMPRRNIDAQGKRVGTSQKWFPLWLPGVNEDALKSGATDEAILFGGKWPDDSPSTEPPPGFWDSMVRRPPMGGGA